MEKMLPNNLEQEKELLGTILMDENVFLKVNELLESKDFYSISHQVIFSTIKELFDKKKEINVSNLIDRLKEKKQLDNVGGISYIIRLFNLSVSPRNYKNLSKNIQRKSVLRSLITFSKELEYKGFGIDIDNLDDFIYDNEIKFTNIINSYIGKDDEKKVKSKDILVELEKELKMFKGKKIIGYSTGFSKLDHITEGIIVPHTWIIGGFTGTGKTFFTLNILNSILKNGAKVLLFSTENSSNRNILRMIGCSTGISEIKMMKGLVKDELTLDRIEQTKRRIANSGLIIYDDVFDTSKIKLLTQKHKIEDDINIVIIDYIQNLNHKVSDIYARMSKVSSDLISISKESNVAMIGVSQISNSEAMRENDDMMSFKGAGEISAIADVAIWLRRVRNDKDKMIAFVKKVRHGIPNEVTFDFFTEENIKNNCYLKESKEQYVEEKQKKNNGWRT